MIKLMDILKEISGRGNFSADEGEPDTGHISAGKLRILGIDDNKPEPWYEKGGYTQLQFPEADDPFKDIDKNIPIKMVVKKIKNTKEKYKGFQDAVGSWENYGSKDYSTESDEK
tara:strand:+ start:135 stop:476 length:342 start_codon:yes stop_codon:yes gene_type:complete